ncbi:neuroglian-like isoform X2 [Dreissena polymorpha]|uniref:neuroglian-like isoform X2 n=1 Tax=Dreissena polymorpha TaxID=45954 RepID=UPI002264157A|nr:neuroglian-like isoform X2 [Dreissena polymorpha]
MSWFTVYTTLLVAVVCVAVDVPPRVTRPPTIMPESRMEDVVYFDPEGTAGRELTCRAQGNKPILFEWTKNGKLFDISDPKYAANDSRIPRIERTDTSPGTLKFLQMMEMDEGSYQCIAKNAHGLSFSRKIQLIKATKRTFDNPGMETKYSRKPAEALTLVCNPPENNPPGKVNWIKYENGGDSKKSVELSERIAMDTTGNLYFANIEVGDENDGDRYACEVSITKFGMTLTGAYSIIKVEEGIPSAQYPPALMYQSESSVVGLKGERVMFICIFSGRPTPSVTWWKGKEKIESSQKFRISYPWRLSISDLQQADAGEYVCKGTNSLSSGSIDRTFRLDMEAKPEWVAKPVQVDAGVDESAAFECSAEGKPTPTLQWFIDGKPIANVKDDKMVVSPGQLQFHDLTPDDAKVVQCNVSNEHGYLWADVALSVLAYKPESKASFDVIKISEGQTVTLPCEIDGKPTPNIYWKRGGLVMSSDKYPRQPTGNLTILNATQNDAGIWTCFADNKYGKFNSSGELIVREKTVITLSPQPLSQQMTFGKPLVYTCGAKTDPNEIKNLRISWLKDGNPIKFNSRLKMFENYGLRIESTTAEDTGNYTCLATNGLDSDQKSASVEIRAPPDPPRNVKVEECLPRKARISWTPGKDNLRPITKFYVEYNHSYAPNQWTQAVTVQDNKKEAEVLLSPYTNYTFRVIAENQLGKSLPSERSMTGCETKPDTPDHHPFNVRTDRSEPGWLIINWDRMTEIEHNGDKFKYVLTVKHNGVKNVTEILDWKQNQLRVYSGKFYEPYEIYVEAENSKGKFSEPAVIHLGYSGEAEPLTAPGNFELVEGINVTATEATFQWDPVDTSPQAMRGEFKGYKIRFWKADQKNTTLKEVMFARQAPVDPRTRRATPNVKERATVKDLPPFSDIEADVVACNSFYDSNSSNIEKFVTLEGVPSKPHSAGILLRGSHHFLINWEEPKEPNGIITGYQIGYQTVDGFNIGDMVIAEVFNNPDLDRAIINNLTDNTMYTIHIMAMTSKGVGDAYYLQAKTAGEGQGSLISALIKPTIEFTLIGEDFVNVSWSVPANTDQPAGLYHYVQYKKEGDLEWKKSSKDDVNSWMNISSLEPNTRYQMIVVASNDKVDQFSEMKHVTTQGGPGPIKTDVSIAQASWFIAMMVAIAVLILFFIIVCFIKRRRGEKYNVQEREKLRGADLENGDRDLMNEYQKIGELDPLAAGSPDSFDNDPDKLPGGSETDSMAEYGDVDPSKFNEDGSFIGQYGNQIKDEKGNHQSGTTTFV